MCNGEWVAGNRGTGQFPNMNRQGSLRKQQKWKCQQTQWMEQESVIVLNNVNGKLLLPSDSEGRCAFPRSNRFQLCVPLFSIVVKRQTLSALFPGDTTLVWLQLDHLSITCTDAVGALGHGDKEEGHGCLRPYCREACGPDFACSLPSLPQWTILQGDWQTTSLGSILAEKRGVRFWVRKMLPVFMASR